MNTELEVVDLVEVGVADQESRKDFLLFEEGRLLNEMWNKEEADYRDADRYEDLPGKSPCNCSECHFREFYDQKIEDYLRKHPSETTVRAFIYRPDEI